MPIRDFGVPTVEQMIATLDLIDAALEDGENVYVHCRMGIGRTRTVIGYVGGDSTYARKRGT